MYDVALRDEIRMFVLVEGHTQRAAAQRFRIARNTVAKLLQEPAEPSMRRYQRRNPPKAPVAEAALPPP